jgi:4-cresol dehydrogenase (hydroxylating)
MGVWSRMGRTKTAADGFINAHFGFYPIIPRTGEAVFEAQRVFADVMGEFELPNPASALHTPTSWAMFAYQMGFNTITQDSAVMHKALQRMTKACAEHGWGDYRAPTVDQDGVAHTYSFGDHALLRFNEALKDAVDPNGILAPGRGGVWPSVYRRYRAKRESDV